MNYLSVCSGIEAATVAWEPLGWHPAAFSEVEAFPSAVLQHHYPDTPNLGDMLKYEEWRLCRCISVGSDELFKQGQKHDERVGGRAEKRPGTHDRDEAAAGGRGGARRTDCPDCGLPAVDVLVGGTPCQSFSVAGLRKGLEDPRGNLTLGFLGLVAAFRPRWVVWENVPGVRSDRGNAFGQFIGGLDELGYDCAWRSLDAQYFDLAQRRERVFVVASPRGAGVHPFQILLEPESLRGDPAPRREAGEVAPTVPSRGTAGGGLGTDFDLDGGLVPAMAFHNRQDPDISGDVTHPIGAKDNGLAIGFQTRIGRNGRGDTGDIANALNAHSGTMGKGDSAPCVAVSSGGWQVRRLTVRECERLQGFPDDYTRIPWRTKPAEQCPDGPRYKALGNSMAVPVMRWIGGRIKR